MAAKYWHRNQYPNLIYYFEEDKSVWMECVGSYRYSSKEKGYIGKTNFNEPGKSLLKGSADPIDLFLLMTLHERYDIRKELLKDILIDISANIAPLKVGSR